MRNCGVLLPVSALSSAYGIGTFGAASYAFVDFLKEGGQTYWQMLPLLPSGFGDSPYHSFSVFAGNPYLIDLGLLIDQGLLTKEECACVTWNDKEDEISYSRLYHNRFNVLRSAFARSGYENDCVYKKFKACHSDWLDDYALFMALKDHFGERPWPEWEIPVKFRQQDAMDYYRNKLQCQVEFWRYLQYLFFVQYDGLKSYAAAQGIRIIGDMPIYPALDSADVWSNANLFSLDGRLNPTDVAGVPPDYFSKEGQLWGNPVYNWDKQQPELFCWWRKRVRAAQRLYDTVRIDHFRGFDEYYAVPFGEATAVSGVWKKGPGSALFDYLENSLGPVDLIAEDLGVVTDSVVQLLRRTGFPGMKVLQFGLRAGEDSAHLPHNYTQNSVVYTGTHDNDTLMGWYLSASDSDKAFALGYFRARSADEFADAAISGLYGSVARTVIIPVQDWLGLGSRTRVNTPSTATGNWTWRLLPGALTPALAQKMHCVAVTYRRDRP